MRFLLLNTTLHKIMSALSWTFIHSLWQGLLLAVISSCVLVLTKRSGAVKRYNWLLFLFTGFLITCVGTFIWEWNNETTGQAVTGFVPFSGVTVSALFSGKLQFVREILKACSQFILANEQPIFFCWLAVFMFRIIKLTGAVLYMQRIRNKEVYEPGMALKKTCMALCEKLQVGKIVSLLESRYCKVPVVLGHIKPLILLPAGLLTGLPADQVEAILLHELAHIRRNDYLINFLQSIAEAIFFFNPFSSWISSLLREERENCCDDIALLQMKNRKGLAEALISFKEYELYGASFATAFPGRKHLLLRRVSRILGNKPHVTGIGERLFFIPCIILLFAVLAIATVAQDRKDETTATVKANKKDAIINKSIHAIERSLLQVEAGNNRKKIILPVKNIVKETAGVKEITTPDQQSKEEALIAKKLAEQDMMQALKDQAQALKDEIQAKKDHKQALYDQYKARIDEAQAIKDRKSAMEDMTKAKIDYEKALKDKEAAERNEFNR